MGVKKLKKTVDNFVSRLELDKVWLTGPTVGVKPGEYETGGGHIHIFNNNKEALILVSNEEMLNAPLAPDGTWNLDERIKEHLNS